LITIVKAVHRRLLSDTMEEIVPKVTTFSLVKSFPVLIPMAVLLLPLVHKVTSPLLLVEEVTFTLQVL
jgi:hypothetical protein